MISVVWCGMGGGSYAAKQLRPLIESLGMKLTIISEWSDADVAWNLNTWQDEVKKHDIVICPTDQNKFPYKGNNKVTHFMALGMPVIASPLQSYREIIEHGADGFIADNISDWEKCLIRLRDDADFRKKWDKKLWTKLNLLTPLSLQPIKCYLFLKTGMKRLTSLSLITTTPAIY